MLVNQKLKYVGQWKNGKFGGQGKLITEDGDTYEGQFWESLRQGVGILTTGGGYITYSGTWHDDKLNGKAIMIDKKRNERYEG